MNYQKKIQEAKRMVAVGGPKDACGFLRPVLEKYLAELCAKDNARPVSDKIYDMITALSDAGAIDRAKRSRLMHLKNLGNFGSHAGNEDVSVADAKYFIEVLSEFFDFPEDKQSEPRREHIQSNYPHQSYEDEQRRKALICAYYLSEFNHHKLGIGNQGETFNFIAETLAVKESTLRQYRDYFDPITNSNRRGWWQKETPPQFMSIFKEFNGVKEENLRPKVLEFIGKS